MPFDAGTIADACNIDFHFRQAGWEETAESVAAVMALASFRRWLAADDLWDTDGPSLPALVAAIYEHRLQERGAPWGGRQRRTPDQG